MTTKQQVIIFVVCLIQLPISAAEPPKEPPKPIVELPPPWTIHFGPDSENDKLLIKIGRYCETCPGEPLIFVGGGGELKWDSNPPKLDLTFGAGLQWTFGASVESEGVVPTIEDEQETLFTSSDQMPIPLTVSYVLVSSSDPLSLISGMLTLIPSEDFNPAPHLAHFDNNRDGIYEFDPAGFDLFITESVHCPETISFLSTIGVLGFTLLFGSRYRSKLR